MPIEQIPLSDPDPARAVTSKVVELEQAGGEVTGLHLVGDQWVIVYKTKPRVGRPPKTETR